MSGSWQTYGTHAVWCDAWIDQNCNCGRVRRLFMDEAGDPVIPQPAPQDSARPMSGETPT